MIPRAAAQSAPFFTHTQSDSVFSPCSWWDWIPAVFSRNSRLPRVQHGNLFKFLCGNLKFSRQSTRSGETNVFQVEKLKRAVAFSVCWSRGRILSSFQSAPGGIFTAQRQRSTARVIWIYQDIQLALFGPRKIPPLSPARPRRLVRRTRAGTWL